MAIVDLHMHSTASDGQYAPAELVQKAKKLGIEIMALTDHDTIDGLDEAIAEGEKLGIKVIRGIELSADEYPNFHILGYNFRPSGTKLHDMCKEMREGREKRKYRIAEYLKAHGADISVEEVTELAGDSVVGRPHFAQLLLKHGYVTNYRDSFNLYLDTPEFQAFDKGKPSAEKCIQNIKVSGGIASWAHPYQTGLDDEQIEQVVKTLVGCGLDAIECYYPKYTPEQTAFYLHLAEKYGLKVTGGSDFHGEKVKSDVELARWELDVNWLK